VNRHGEPWPGGEVELASIHLGCVSLRPKRSVIGSRGRIGYNLVSAAIVVIYFVVGLPACKQNLSVNTVLFLFLLAVLANAAYCAAYLVDIFAQMSGFLRVGRTSVRFCWPPGCCLPRSWLGFG
jgi:hypothetical protein